MLNQEDTIKVDSAILLLDLATELDSLYFLGYVNKIRFLMIKEDFKRLLETNKRIRQLRPGQPSWIIQRGLILELSGDIEEATVEYENGVKEYENILHSDSNLSWEFELEFAESLVLANNYERALKIIEKMRDQYPDLEIWAAYKLHTKDELLELRNYN